MGQESNWASKALVDVGRKKRELCWYGHLMLTDDACRMKMDCELMVENTPSRGRPRKTWEEVDQT